METANLQEVSIQSREKLMLISHIIFVAVSIKRKVISIDEIYSWARQGFMMLPLSNADLSFAMQELSRKLEYEN